MSTSYLDSLDKLLLAGVSQLSPAFISRQADFITGKQMPDGGFCGRLGGTDLYYTDFGMRLMHLLLSDYSTLESTASTIIWHHSNPKNIIDCFNLLNIIRILSNCDIHISVDTSPLLSILQAQQLVDGGYTRQESKSLSAYNTFIAGLCFEMMEMEFPKVDGAVAVVRGLKCSDGGYCESPEHSLSQTNATAAATAFLTMQNALDVKDAESAVSFLSGMQSQNGGLLAQPSASEADLLSTFTGILSLFGLNALDSIDLPAVARFVGRLAHSDGGFRAGLSDDEPDVEYTYYGLGTMALLRVYVMAKEVEDV